MSCFANAAAGDVRKKARYSSMRFQQQKSSTNRPGSLGSDAVSARGLGADRLLVTPRSTNATSPAHTDADSGTHQQYNIAVPD